jgi:hypothetical protein
MDRISAIAGDIFTKSIERETLKAWEPWRETQSLLFSFQHTEIDSEHPEWRIYWIAGVALLRTIGHVLDKVDRKLSEDHAFAIQQAWTKWNAARQENWIFFEFIEKERNNIMKEYKFGAALPIDGDDRILSYDEGPDDATELFREAVYWWRDELDAIEKALKGKPHA